MGAGRERRLWEMAWGRDEGRTLGQPETWEEKQRLQEKWGSKWTTETCNVALLVQGLIVLAWANMWSWAMGRMWGDFWGGRLGGIPRTWQLCPFFRIVILCFSPSHLLSPPHLLHTQPEFASGLALAGRQGSWRGQYKGERERRNCLPLPERLSRLPWAYLALEVTWSLTTSFDRVWAHPCSKHPVWEVSC